MTLRTITFDDSTHENKIDWNEYFIYDENIEGGLRLKKSRRHRKAGDIAGTRRNDGRWSIKFKTKTKFIGMYNYRVIYEMHHGQIPQNFTIDHIDGNASNNKIENLRAVPLSVNLRNVKLHKTNKTGFSGVNFDKARNRWVARWCDLDGNQCYKFFRVSMYGEENAFKLAVNARKAAIEKLNSIGAGYTERHGAFALSKTEYQDTCTDGGKCGAGGYCKDCIQDTKKDE